MTDATGWGAICALGQHCGGAVPAGFAAFGGVVRPQEIQQGHIDHALVLTASLTRSGYIACPATHTDGVSSDAASIPEGPRTPLVPSFAVPLPASSPMGAGDGHPLPIAGGVLLASSWMAGG